MTLEKVKKDYFRKRNARKSLLGSGRHSLLICLVFACGCGMRLPSRISTQPPRVAYSYSYLVRLRVRVRVTVRVRMRGRVSVRVRDRVRVRVSVQVRVRVGKG